jgi:uncharacterized membrane protein YidH (DUF202 family)
VSTRVRVSASQADTVGGTRRRDKTNAVRLIDVILIGPATIYGGLALRRRGQFHDNSTPGALSTLGLFLIASGVATIVYNWRNLSRNLDDLDEQS